jgi:hypothetical protein
MSDVSKQVIFLVVGGLLLLLNKPLAESQRLLHKELSGEKYRENGVWIFRIPIILIGVLILSIGVSFFFF